MQKITRFILHLYEQKFQTHKPAKGGLTNDSGKKHEIENNIWRENSGDAENKVVIDVLRSTERVSLTKKTRTWRFHGIGYQEMRV